MRKLLFIATMVLMSVSNLNAAFSAEKAKKIPSILVKGTMLFDMYGKAVPMNGASVQLHNDKLGTFPKVGFITGSDGKYFIDVPPNAIYNLYVNGRFVSTTHTLTLNTDLRAMIGGRSTMQTVSRKSKRVNVYLPVAQTENEKSPAL